MTTEVLPSHLDPLSGAVPSIVSEPSFLDVIGFTKTDLVWSLGLWLATIGLAPFVIFYALMVN